MHDAVVIGGGPAGLAATTWLARYRRKVLLIDGGEPRNRWVEHAHGYLGLDPCSPADLRTQALGQIRRYETVGITDGQVDAASRIDGAFRVHTAEAEWSARRLVVATGVHDVFPEVEGFFEHYGASVFHCPACDGFEARGRRIVVFGWDAHVAGFALSLYDWAAQVTIVTNGRAFEGDGRHRKALARHRVALLETSARRLIGERGRLEAVELGSGERLACTLAFFSITHEPQTALAEGLGCALDGDGYIAVDHEGHTSVEGVYAAGDVTPGTQLIQVAAAQGAAAGIACALSLRGDEPSALPTAPDVEEEVPGD